MDTQSTLPDDAVTKAAADAIVELALNAFETPFLCWTPEVNTAIAACAWNEADPRTRVFPPNHDFPEPRMRRLYERLSEMRRTQFGGVDVSVWDLAVHIENREMVFTFLVSWDGGESGRPCRIVVDASCYGDGPPPEWS